MMGHGVGVLLLAAVAGYWVLERAETHKGDLRRVGKGLGWLIIVASLIGVVCKVWCYAGYPSGAMGMGKRGFMCPFSKFGSMSPMSGEAPAKDRK